MPFFSPHEEGGGSVQQLPLDEIFDCTHENDHESLPLAMLTCPKNNNCFSLRFKEKRAARRVRNSMPFSGPKTAMWVMLRCSHFVNISIQALQTSSNVNSMMLNERAKREQLFFLYSLKASKNKVAKLPVFECDLVQPCARTSNCSSAMSFAS